jgi:hypothetical protein
VNKRRKDYAKIQMEKNGEKKMRKLRRENRI